MNLLDIEKALSGPDGQAAMERYDAVLLGLSERVKQELDAGLPPQEFSRCQELQECVVLARKLLRLQLRQNEVCSSSREAFSGGSMMKNVIA